MIELTEQPINSDAILQSVNSVHAGANVLFLGTTRQFTGDVETVTLDYDGYQEMAVKKLNSLRDAAMEKWPVVACSIVHRLGTVGLGEASLAVAVSTPHRKASFEAAEWILERLKQEVPIWKREHAVDGSAEWVHPSNAVATKSDEGEPS